MNMQAHQSSGMAHHDDPAKQKEHMAALDLVKHSDATHVAVKSGNWSDASTWKGGKVPGSGAKVLIGDGLDVTYNVKSDAPLKTLRVDGQLDFATKRSTKMVIDTFVVSPTGTLTIGTQRNPVAGNVDAEIWIADNGKIDRKWDPTQVSRGLISHGEVEIYGQQKTSHIKVSKDAMAGDRELVLDGAPKNWQVGDSLVLTGTEYVPDKWNPQKRQMEWQGTQDEELTIKAINGNRVTLDRPLTYDHDTPRGDLKAYVTNFSRSVTIATENADRLPANQRGHVMFMHSDDVDVRYAAFQELGRSDKSKRFDDFRTTGNETRILDGKGNTQPGAANNIRGRYAVHFHRAGADISGAPARAVGNAVWGSPGWGFVNHDSHVVMENNAAYDVFGSAFVTETGNEVGAIRNNIAIKSEGASEISKVGTRNHDVARNGVGFWFQGRLVDNENNVAAGQRQAGSVYLLRGEDQEDVLTDNLEFEETGRYQEDLLVGRPHIESFKNNEVIASGKGLEVIKANPNQGHDVRSVIDGLKAWEVRTGTHLEYTSKYTLKDLDFIGTKGARTGISFGNNAEDMVVNGARVRGFDTGLKTTKKHTFAKIDNWRYAFIDADIEGKKVNINGQDQFLSSGNLQKGRLKLDISSNTDFHFNGREDVKINGTKTDSIGSVGYWTGSDSYEVKGSGLRNRIRDGYYTDKNGTPFFTVEERVADRATGDTVQLDYVFTIDNSQKNLLQGARKLGTYSGTVQRGLAQGSLKSFVDKNSGGDRPKKTNHSDMDHGGGGGGGGMDDMPGADAGPVPNQPKTGGGNGGNQGGNNADNADKPTPDAGPRPGGNSTPPASKVSDSPDSSNGSDPIRLEAEDMSLNGFRVERNGGVSGKEVISFAGGRGGESGRATTTFNGPAGTYDVVVGYVDENDGKATLEAKLNGQSLDKWQLTKSLGDNYITQRTRTQRTIGRGVSIEKGDRLQLLGQEQAGEHARVDYVELIPVKGVPKPSGKSADNQGSQADSPAPAPKPTPAPKPAPKASDSPDSSNGSDPIRLEAEDMSLNGFRVERNGGVSGKEVISFAGGRGGESGRATTTFNGPAGTYDVVVGYVDENDGKATLEAKLNGQSLDKWQLTKSLGDNYITQRTRTQRTIGRGVSIEKGDRLQLLGQEQAGEHARVDYVELIPVEGAKPKSSGGSNQGSKSGGAGNSNQANVNQAVNSASEADVAVKGLSTPAPGDAIRLEAEDMTLKGYRVERNGNGSGNKFASFAGGGSAERGSASTTFNGPAGTYNMVVSYVDETDGKATLEAKVNGQSLDKWQLAENLGDPYITRRSLTQRTVGDVSLEKGDRLQILGQEQASEHARIDYVELTPIKGGAPAQVIKSPVKLEGSSWKAIPVDYEVTPNTVMQLEFRSRSEGAIHAIGLDDDAFVNASDRKELVQLSGTETWGVDGFDYTAKGWQTFDIPIGQFADDDASFVSLLTVAEDGGDAVSEFRNVSLFESVGSSPLSASNPLANNGLAADDSNLAAMTTDTTI